MIITITGTPGCGKTYIAKKIVLSSKKKFAYVDLNKIIKDEKLYDSYDKRAKTYDVDVKKLKKIEKRFEKYSEKSEKSMDNTKIKKSIKTKNITTLNKVITILKKKEGIIIDSHLSHYLKSDLCIVIKTDIKTLKDRLEKRNYPNQKIKDNIESEIFEICLEEAKNLKRNIIVLQN
ncbi:MAG: AAA family ATPase [Candidatus Woesearchaeota archaeon]